ncbi:MAG: glycosyltransferase family 4 protein [Armatimonadota bacterium]|nr:glycosyltransferase family 4 protein [Armatimonadota bacterium]
MPGAGGRIRVCHVLEATEGGTRQYLMDACLGLPADRFQQTAVVSVRRDPTFEQDIQRLREGDVAVEVVDMVREVSWRQDLRALRELRRYFAEHAFDIIHAHSSKAGMLARLAAWRAGNPAARIYSPHAFAFTMDVSRWRQVLYLLAERLAGRITDILICTCDSERELAVRHRIVPPGRAVVVRTGVDLRVFHPGSEGHRVRREMDLPDRHRLVGSVGAMVEQKGHRFLVEAAPLVLEEMPHTTFVLAGDGALRAELQERAAALALGRRMRFLGHRDDVPRILAALDLFVMPSLWEGMPYALVEAMAVGLPVVGSAVPGIVDLIEPGRTGWLAPPADAEGLAAGILQALREEGVSARMAQAGRDLVVREHSRERMLAALAGIYERVAEDRS